MQFLAPRRALLYLHCRREASPNYIGEAHLDHLCAARETHLHADAAFAARDTPREGRPLNVVRLVERQTGVRIELCYLGGVSRCIV
jgi:hypothetical protein